MSKSIRIKLIKKLEAEIEYEHVRHLHEIKFRENLIKDLKEEENAGKKKDKENV